MAEGGQTGTMFVLVSGSLEVTSRQTRIAAIDEPGSAIGEIAALLDTTHGATVTATSEAKVHVIDDPTTLLAEGDTALEVARTLAGRLDRMVGYLADVKAQYAEAGGHLELLDEILGELTFGSQPRAEGGSERDPEPPY